MEANELRLGNLILYNGKVTEVESVSLFYVNVGIHDDGLQINIEDCSPIPLTEEWLLKFGFTTGDGDYFLKEVIDDLGISYILEEKQLHLIYFCDTGGVTDAILIPKEIKYINQLQNLYFALTGEELRI